MGPGAEKGQRRPIGKIVEMARRATALPGVARERFSTGWNEHRSRVESKAEAIQSREEAYSNLGRGELNGVNRVQIIAVLRAESALVRLEESDLTPAGCKKLKDSDILTSSGQNNTADFLTARGEYFEQEALKKRREKDTDRKIELLRRAQACQDAAALMASKTLE
ncbi:MAG TPA: hypothetical protein VM077_05525 [Candidatus Limnocylindrales bacterium]|nr:hypothetical protein [Candidatus Limnocylindrales bacterium]